MPVFLEILDGSPWWLSPDIWVVPGDDPEGLPGLPVVGSNAFLWARVHNSHGSTDAQNATVKFYWADPSVGFDRTSANVIGTSYVDLNAGQTSDVLCLTPWVPVYEDEGHECVLAEAFHSSDPLPISRDFNVPTDRHVAQRNLSVLEAQGGMFAMRFSVHNTWRTERAFSVGIKKGTVDQLRPLAKTLGRAKIPKDADLHNAGFLRERRPSEQDVKRAAAEADVVVGPNGRSELTLVGQVGAGATLVHVVQSSAAKLTGGLSVLVIS